MPFKKEKTLPVMLGISDARGREIYEEVHKLLHEVAEDKDEHNDKFLLAMYEKYDDKELLLAVYYGVRILDRHMGIGTNPFADLEKLLDKFLKN